MKKKKVFKSKSPESGKVPGESNGMNLKETMKSSYPKGNPAQELPKIPGPNSTVRSASPMGVSFQSRQGSPLVRPPQLSSKKATSKSPGPSRPPNIVAVQTVSTFARIKELQLPPASPTKGFNLTQKMAAGTIFSDINMNINRQALQPLQFANTPRISFAPFQDPDSPMKKNKLNLDYLNIYKECMELCEKPFLLSFSRVNQEVSSSKLLDLKSNEMQLPPTQQMQAIQLQSPSFPPLKNKSAQNLLPPIDTSIHLQQIKNGENTVIAETPRLPNSNLILATSNKTRKSKFNKALQTFKLINKFQRVAIEKKRADVEGNGENDMNEASEDEGDETSYKNIPELPKNSFVADVKQIFKRSRTRGERDAHLLLLHFEGILGEDRMRAFWEEEEIDESGGADGEGDAEKEANGLVKLKEEHYLVRDEVKNLLTVLAKHYLVVLIFPENNNFYKELAMKLGKAGYPIDAAYAINDWDFSQTADISLVVDYNNILKEMKLGVLKRVLVINSLGMNPRTRFFTQVHSQNHQRYQATRGFDQSVLREIEILQEFHSYFVNKFVRISVDSDRVRIIFFPFISKTSGSSHNDLLTEICVSFLNDSTSMAFFQKNRERLCKLAFSSILQAVIERRYFNKITKMFFRDVESQRRILKNLKESKRTAPVGEKPVVFEEIEDKLYRDVLSHVESKMQIDHPAKLGKIANLSEIAERCVLANMHIIGRLMYKNMKTPKEADGITDNLKELKSLLFKRSVKLDYEIYQNIHKKDIDILNSANFSYFYLFENFYPFN